MSVPAVAGVETRGIYFKKQANLLKDILIYLVVALGSHCVARAAGTHCVYADGLELSSLCLPRAKCYHAQFKDIFKYRFYVSGIERKRHSRRKCVTKITMWHC